MSEQTIFTNLCMIRDGNRVVVMERLKQDWPGVTMPGGHVEDMLKGMLDDDLNKFIYRKTGDDWV